MSRSKKILVVSAFGPVALMLTTRWGVLAGADCMRTLCVPERVVKPGRRFAMLDAIRRILKR